MTQKNSEESEIVLYQTDEGKIRLEVRLVEETVWLTQRLLSNLYQVGVNTINHHIKEIYEDRELLPEATIRKYRIVQVEGKRKVERQVDHYNLEMIMAIGYRVRSERGIQFRRWATSLLKEYVIKGFVLDDERLKNPPGPGVTDYFDEVLERIRDIRASERRMYLRVREIFVLAVDYEPKDEETQVFFQIVQNKLHFAVTGKTAPELITERARHKKSNMGLTSWKGDAVRKGDVTIAKNYLLEDEISELNRIVTMFLDFAEDQAKRRKQVFMKDWKKKLDDFLKFNDRSVLPHAGKVSREDADRLANQEYDQFEKDRRIQLEAEGEQDSMRQLEDAAKKWSQMKSAKKK